MLHVDIIGDPANYPQSWKDNGVMGTPLLVDEAGVSLVPNGNSQIFKMSRKMKGQFKLWLKSADNGQTWTDLTSAINATLDQTANSVTFNCPVGELRLGFYDTEASPFELASNAEVLSLGGVKFSQSADWNEGALLIPWLINKVGEEPRQDYGTQRLQEPSSVVINDTGFINTSNEARPAHTVITPLGTTYKPAVKALPYLTRANGKLLLQTVYKEMHHNGASWGDDEKFNIVDNESTTTDDNAYTVKIGQKRIKSELLPYFIGDAD